MPSECTEIEIELLESKLQETTDRLDCLSDADVEIREELERNQKLLISDIEKANKKLLSELKCIRNQKKFLEN